MGIIDDDGKILPGRDPLEATWDIGNMGGRFADLIGRRPVVQRHSDRSQQVIDVVLPDQPALNGERACGSRRSKGGPGKREVHSFRLEIGLVLNGIAPDRHGTG